MANYIVSENCVHINDSAFISKKEFQPILEEIANTYPDNEVVKTRFFYSAKCEWAVHNLLYNINYQRERTKDVDINLLKWYIKVIYFILGSISLLFIR